MATRQEGSSSCSVSPSCRFPDPICGDSNKSVAFFLGNPFYGDSSLSNCAAESIDVAVENRRYLVNRVKLLRQSHSGLQCLVLRHWTMFRCNVLGTLLPENVLLREGAKNQFPKSLKGGEILSDSCFFKQECGNFNGGIFRELEVIYGPSRFFETLFPRGT